MRLLGQAKEREMPFLEHLEELRRAILGAFGAILICAIGGYVVSGHVVDYMVVQHVGEAQFLRPMEAFLARVKVSLLLGLIVSLPFVMFQIWNFVVPGLLEQERKLVLPMVIWSTVLFLVGTAFSYFVLTPTMVQLLVGFATEHIRANISVEYLLDFIIRLALACGILFQLPLVVALLTIVRVVTPQFLWSKWRHAIVAILVVAAVATPGDGPSQIVLAAPIIVLYFLSILVSLLIVRNREEEDEDDGDDEGPDDDNRDGGGGSDRKGSRSRTDPAGSAGQLNAGRGSESTGVGVPAVSGGTVASIRERTGGGIDSGNGSDSSSEESSVHHAPSAVSPENVAATDRIGDPPSHALPEISVPSSPSSLRAGEAQGPGLEPGNETATEEGREDPHSDPTDDLTDPVPAAFTDPTPPEGTEPQRRHNPRSSGGRAEVP